MLANILSRYWWMILLRGLAWLIFGILVFTQPAISLVTLTLLFGAFALVDGIANTVSPCSLVRDSPWRCVPGLNCRMHRDLDSLGVRRPSMQNGGSLYMSGTSSLPGIPLYRDGPSPHEPNWKGGLPLGRLQTRGN